MAFTVPETTVSPSGLFHDEAVDSIGFVDRFGKVGVLGFRESGEQLLLLLFLLEQGLFSSD